MPKGKAVPQELAYGKHEPREIILSTNHADFVCENLAAAVRLMQECSGKRIEEMDIPAEAKVQNATRELFKPFALDIELENGVMLYIPLEGSEGWGVRVWHSMVESEWLDE